MNLNEAMRILSKILSGARPLPEFRDFILALAAVLDSDFAPPNGFSQSDWPRLRLKTIVERSSFSLNMKCSQNGSSRIERNPSEEWRQKLLNDAVNQSLIKVDEKLEQQIRERFIEEVDEANILFVNTNFDPDFLFQSYLAHRSATVTAKLLKERGLPEQMSSYGSRVNIAYMLLEERQMGWKTIYLKDLQEYQRLLRNFEDVARPNTLIETDIRWEPVTQVGTGGPHAGENTIMKHLAYVVENGQKITIYTGYDNLGDFNSSDFDRPDHEKLAAESLSKWNDQRISKFNDHIGSAINELNRAINDARNRAIALWGD